MAQEFGPPGLISKPDVKTDVIFDIGDPKNVGSGVKLNIQFCVSKCHFFLAIFSDCFG